MEPIEPSLQEEQADSAAERLPEPGQPTPQYDKPTIGKVDESRHGDFWCD